jgi:hypothetical protein
MTPGKRVRILECESLRVTLWTQLLPRLVKKRST